MGATHPRIVPPSPFGQLEPDLRSYFETAVLEAFGLAAESEDPSEERWAYDQLNELYREAIATMDDRAPTLIEVLKWASYRRALAEPS